MPLPLLEHLTQGDSRFCPLPASPDVSPRNLIPIQPLKPGEQYRFHFDASKCIGCKCCEVACSEQNNNPPHIRWRRVGEIEGGSYPFTQRFYLSMGCNHCLEPSCLNGCPVNAYTKDSVTGIVLHSADACIGCQYCTWNCQYGVPQYNAERGVVGKCDLCYNRLADSREPACVSACPQEAIAVEAVNVEAWRAVYAETANAPGLPVADQTVSTTRVTLPQDLPLNVRKADYHRTRPEHPHTPLIVMTVLTQLSWGAFAYLWLLTLTGAQGALKFAAAAALAVAMLSLGAATLHLGRPIHAYRALRMWRRSWLSREVLAFALFSKAAGAYAALCWFDLPGQVAAGSLTVALGAAGVLSSAFIYLVPARPAWNNRHTVAEFFLTGAILGPLFVATLVVSSNLLVYAAVAAAGAQLLNQTLKFLWLSRSDEYELRASARLLSGELERVLLVRMGLLLAAIALPLMGYASASLVAALIGELAGRWLFFVSVVPKNMAAGFFSLEEAA